MTFTESPVESRELWPPISPWREGLLQVSDAHAIHYALYGNALGIPVFFLHGGPACGCEDDDARWFDPKNHLIVLHDQRGSGKSTPWAEIRGNTTQELVEDIERLRLFLDIDIPISIFGGSWGSTLALLYAQTYPAQVRRMILRGIFTCTYDEQDFFYSAGGAARFSPAAWDEFISSLPEGSDRVQERLHRLIETDDKDERRKWSRILAAYEYSFFQTPPELENSPDAFFDSLFAEMRINMHFQNNRFFLDDGQILNNAERIRHIPTHIIHGKRDVICPPRSAWNLHKALPKSKLTLVDGAEHVSSEPGIQRALFQALDQWRKDDTVLATS